MLVSGQSIYMGSSAITAVYQGEDLVWTANPYSLEYLTFDIISGGTIAFFATGDFKCSIDYSINNGSWISTSITGDTPNYNKINVSAGDKVRFRGNNEFYHIDDSSDPEYPYLGSSYFVSLNDGAYFNIYGNIMSMIYGDSFKGKISVRGFDYVFYGLFNETRVVSAENLILPAMGYCIYTYLFRDCVNLISAPKLYRRDLAENCYSSMFLGCSSLTTAPELPAKALPQSCYAYMFGRCSALNYVKCLATTMSYSSSTMGWLSNVSPTGTFVKDANTTWSTGVNGIPTGWTVEAN